MTGLFGGTFDPFHLGHLDVLRAARRALRLSRIVVMPSHLPPHRDTPQASGTDRMAMAACAIDGEPACEVSDMELATAGPSYTALTIDRFTAAGADGSSLCFVTGADAFSGIEAWHQYPGLLDRCHFAVVSRPELPAPYLRTALPSLASRMIDVSLDGSQDLECETTGRPVIFLIDAPTSPVSSTGVRARIARGASLAECVPDAVAAYIETHRLYRLEAHAN